MCPSKWKPHLGNSSKYQKSSKSDQPGEKANTRLIVYLFDHLKLNL